MVSLIKIHGELVIKYLFEASFLGVPLWEENEIFHDTIASHMNLETNKDVVILVEYEPCLMLQSNKDVVILMEYEYCLLL